MAKKETLVQMAQRHALERAELKKKLAEQQRKENEKYTKKMVAAVRAFYKGKTDKEIMEYFQAQLQQQKNVNL